MFSSLLSKFNYNMAFMGGFKGLLYRGGFGDSSFSCDSTYRMLFDEDEGSSVDCTISKILS